MITPKTPNSPLQLRELFHLEFLRRLGMRLKPNAYVLKGGINMRFFFGSPRFSEDMDLDARGIGLHDLQDAVMKIITSPSFRDALSAHGIAAITAPDISKAKQTETTQRFKIHLHTVSGEDLFTKIEFSRRGMAEGIAVETVRSEIVRILRLPPLICPHYSASTAIGQKIEAIAGRTVTQARDIFDLFLLSSHFANQTEIPIRSRATTLPTALKNIYTVDFVQFRDTVLAYFAETERLPYADHNRWDEILLVVSGLIESLL